MTDNKNSTKNIVCAAVFLSLGMVLPFFTAQVKEIGDSLLPMHFVVLLCGVICGYKYGFLVGLILPFLRAACFSMPPMYPNAVWMSFELATYGYVIGILYSKIYNKKLSRLYFSLIISMICGRIIWGISKAILLGFAGKTFTMAMFVAGAITDAIPGIIVQLVLIPFIIKVKEKMRINTNKE